MNKKNSLSYQERLDAWDLWKQICSVNGCSPTEIQPDDLETNPERREKLQNFLIGIFCKGFHRRYLPIMEDTLSPNEIIPFLDTLINEFAPKSMQNDQRHPKCFKDYVWLKCRDSENPVKGIEGMLTGGHGYMNDFVRDYLNYNTCGHTLYGKITRKDGTECKTQVYYSHESLTVFDDDGEHERDVESLLFNPAQNSNEEELTVLQTLADKLTLRQKVVLVAYYKRLSLANPAVSQAAGIGRSGCYEAQEQAFKLIKEAFQELDDYASAIRVLISLINSQLQSEKALKNFFLVLSEPKSNQECDYE